MKRTMTLVAALLWMGAPASAHNLDVYLQSTTLAVAKDRIQAQVRLTPGVAVLPAIFKGIDTNGDEVFSAAEQRTYAERVLRDLSLTMDGKRLPLHLVSWRFGKTGDMKEGLGHIEVEFEAQASRSRGRNRSLVFENHHQRQIAAYLVNCMVPSDPDIQITAQNRDYQQSRYRLDYVQTTDGGVRSSLPSRSSPSGAWGWLGTAALLLVAPLLYLKRQPKWLSKAIGNKTTNDLSV